MSRSIAGSGLIPPTRRSRLAYPVVVCRSDLRALQVAGPPPGSLPDRHGDDGDPRYPSPVGLLRAGAFATDVLVHLVIAAGAATAVNSLDSGGYLNWPPLAAFAVAYTITSLLHRVALQSSFQATAGKALTGLRVIRDDDGQPPGMMVLLREWLTGVMAIALEIIGNM